MDKALENFGIFDFMGVWGPGAITVTYFYFTMQNNFVTGMKFFDITLPKVSEPYSLLILFTAVAYVVGVILHELGKFVADALSLFDKATVKGLAYNQDANFAGVFGPIKKEYQAAIVKEIPNEKFYNNTSFDEAYAFLKYASKAGTKRIDKYHSICAFSRSLSICFAIHALVELIVSVVQKHPVNFGMLVLDSFLGLLFWVRTYRYYSSWIRNTLVQYYCCKKHSPVKKMAAQKSKVKQGIPR